MSDWRFANPESGMDLEDNMVRLFDLRFADDVILFAKNLLDGLMRHLAAAGCCKNFASLDCS